MRYAAAVRLFLLIGVISTLITLGLASTSASSANISHSYHMVGAVTNGSLVSLDPQRSDYVQPANTGNGSRLLGVAVVASDSLIAVNPTQGNTQVATSGTATALVSNLDGDINVGDQVAVSPFNGIGMKALPGSYIIGLAQSAMTANSSGVITEQVTDKSGKASTISVGFIRVNIAIGVNNTSGGTSSLNSLQKIVKSLTGHVVSTARIIISIIIAAVATIALMTLIYASIFGSIISIGRNPLASHAVFRTLGVVLFMALLTAGFAGLIITFLLH